MRKIEDNKLNVGRVVEILLDKFVISTKNEKIQAIARGNVKKNCNIVVGDIVKFKVTDNENIIQGIEKRKNKVIRPPVANIDQMVICLAIKEPVPDYMLLDMQIVFCLANNIDPVICINKIDLDNDKDTSDNLEYIRNVYEKIGIKVLYVSAKEKIGFDSLFEILNGKTSAFSGNSGVGKSSITKMLINEGNIEIGDIASKTSRGKHTTKYVKLYELDDNTFILDTPGFSSYELYDVNHKELKNYFIEFNDYVCDFDDCMHVIEKENVCKVKEAVISGKIDKNRYERYVYIFNKLKEAYDKRYK